MSTPTKRGHSPLAVLRLDLRRKDAALRLAALELERLREETEEPSAVEVEVRSALTPRRS